MKKVLSVLFPYIMIGYMWCSRFLSYPFHMIVDGLIIGLMIGIWIKLVASCQGTIMMKLATILNIVLLVLAAIFVFIIPEFSYFKDMISFLSMLIGLECIVLYLNYQNQPRLSMTYGYSYKNSRRRYF